MRMGSNLLPLTQASLENVEDNQSCCFHVRNQNRRKLEKQKCLTKYHSFYSIPFHSISFPLLTPSPSLSPPIQIIWLAFSLHSKFKHISFDDESSSCVMFSLSLSLSWVSAVFFCIKKEWNPEFYSVTTENNNNIPTHPVPATQQQSHIPKLCHILWKNFLSVENMSKRCCAPWTIPREQAPYIIKTS